MSDPSGAPCERCPLGVTRAVASRGPVPARILLLSGAPRYHEEREGIAFASPAFTWLEEMLSAVGIDPGTVHYATLTGCRPPYQRPLRDAEIEACSSRLGATIAALDPPVIALCGPDVLNAVLPGAALAATHGQIIVRGQRRYYPLRHPYAALHYDRYVAEVETDLRRLAELLATDALPDIARDDAAPAANRESAHDVVVAVASEPVHEDAEIAAASGLVRDAVAGVTNEPVRVEQPATVALESLSVGATGAVAILADESDAGIVADTRPQAALEPRTGAPPGADDDTPTIVEGLDDDRDAPAQLSLF